MPGQLRLLLIEDSETDAELVEIELRRHGYDVTARRVASAAGLENALAEGPWDIALSDHSLPGFASAEAQEIVNESSPDLPFVILSGTIGEEATVDALRSGARDVVLKAKLSRLGLVVDRVLEDAEQRRRHRDAETELFESNERKSAILDSALDCIVTIDHEGRIVDFNPAAEETFGYLEEDVRGKPMVDLIVPPSLRDRHREGFARHLATGRSSIVGARLELTAMRADGSEFPIELAVTRTDLSTNPFFTAYLRDITAQKKGQADREHLEQQLNQARKMEAIGSLAGGVAHDFNNILTVIRASTSFLARELGDTPPAARVRQIDLAAVRAGELTQQLLAFSRQQVLKLESIDLNTVVDETLQMVDRVLGEDIQLKAQLGRPLHPIVVDRVQVQQVVLNLIVNARDAMPDGGALELRTRNAAIADEPEANAAGDEAGLFVLLEVSDTGVGMDESTRERVFDPFFTTKADGTGLGLATVYGIVTQSGGQIFVASDLGRGTTFRVYFPAGSAEVAAPPAPTAVTSLEGNETILLVDDSELVRPLVAEVLESYGYTVLTAVDGIEALAIAASHQGTIDLLLTDVVMPRMNGRELADRLLAKAPGMKVLLTSGYPGGSVGSQGVAVSGAGFIQKPYLADDLAAAIRRVLEPAGDTGVR